MSETFSNREIQKTPEVTIKEETHINLNDLKQQLDEKVGKIIFQTQGVVVGKKAMILGKEKKVYTYESLGLGKVLNITSKGTILFEKSLYFATTGSKYDSEKLGIGKFVDFGEDNILVGDNGVLLIDIESNSYGNPFYDLGWGDNVNVIENDKYNLVISSPKGIASLGKISTEITSINFEKYGIGKIESITLIKDKKNSGYHIIGSNGVMRTSLDLSKRYYVSNDLGLGKIKYITSTGFVQGTNGIARIGNDNKLIYKISAEDLGMRSILTFGSGKITGKDLNWKGQVARINFATGKIKYKSSDLPKRTISKLNDLGIKDIDRFGYKTFINHIIKNRKNIEKLGKQDIVLIVQPRSDYNGAFSTDNQELFMNDHDVLYYEIGSDVDLENVFQELQNKIPKDVNIKHFILGGHGSQKRIRLGEGNKDNAFLDASEGGVFEKYAELFKNTESIILKSCSTGKGGLDEDNILKMVSKSFGKYVERIVAPRVDTNNIYEFLPDIITRVPFYFNGPIFRTDQISEVSGEEYEVKT